MNKSSFLNRVKADLTPKQEQLDINDNGKIDKDDFDKLNDGTPPDPVGGSAKVTAANTTFKFVGDTAGIRLTKSYEDAELFTLPKAGKLIRNIENSAIIPDPSGDYLVIVMNNPFQDF